MATVYLAVQESVERRVALKVMSPVLLVDDTFSERFIREAKIAANLYHPHIVAVHDVGVHESQHFIAMEYLSGEDLARRCEQGLEVATAVRVCREIATALNYAHSKGFVHRDVKPENILFREDDTAVLSDFGIARALNSATQMTKTGAVIGTPQYMSPEQARGKELDGRSDLYSLGVVFYEMLTGQVPYEGSDSIAVGIQHVTEPIPRLPGKIAYVQPVLERFLAKNPEERYQTGGEALEDLQALERRITNGEFARVSAPEPPPRSAGRATRISEPPASAEVKNARRVARPANVAATPRPDGSLRQEPKLGQIDDIGSFDRTVGQPRYEHAPAARKKPARRWPALLILVFGVLGAALWWRWDLVQQWLPDREIDRLLAQASEAQDSDRWYGDAGDFANVLYRQVLSRDPGNRRALAGLELVALHLCDLAERALVDGNPRQAELLLQRAAELAPALPRIAALNARIDGRDAPVDLEPEPEPEPERPPQPDPAERIAALLAEAEALLADGRLVAPADASALSRYRSVLELDPANATARAGLERMSNDLRTRLEQALEAEAIDDAEARYQELALVVDDASALTALRRSLDDTRTRIEQRARAAEQRAQRIRTLLAEGRERLADDRLGEPAGDSAIDRFRQVLTEDPDNSEAREGLTAVARRYLALTEIALEDDRLDQAEQMIARIEALRPALPGLDRAKRRLATYREQNLRNQVSDSDRQRIDELMLAGRSAMEASQLMSPPGESAYDRFKAVLRIDPNHEGARAGLRDVSERLLAAARSDLSGGNLDRALAFHRDAGQVDPDNESVPLLRPGLAAAARGAVRAAIGRGDLSRAEELLKTAVELDPTDPDAAKVQLEFNIARDIATDG